MKGRRGQWMSVDGRETEGGERKNKENGSLLESRSDKKGRKGRKN